MKAENFSAFFMDIFDDAVEKQGSEEPFWTDYENFKLAFEDCFVHSAWCWDGYMALF